MEDSRRNSLFAAVQQIGKSLFLPIAVLPFAGLMLGIGSSFTNSGTIASYGLDGVLHQGTFLYALFTLLAEAGNVIFVNLPLLFALAVALGMAKKEKGVAVMSAGVFYLVMLATIGACLVLDGSIVDGVVADHVKEGAIASVLGIQTLQIGVFGGIVAGIASAAICNRFYKMRLPDVFAFFSGTRFVPIACMVFGFLTGIALYFVWPLIQQGIFELGGIVQVTGAFGSFLYGCINRLLLPFGLHHIFYTPFWQTGLGGTEIVDGVTVMGAQNIFFAELASPSLEHYSHSARFLSGAYPYMLGGLPGAALAMIACAHSEKMKAAGSLLLSAAVTCFLTGITEPIEFTFLFLAPVLYGIHTVLAGISYAICDILDVCVGTTFSNGLIDFVLYGVLQGQDETNWMAVVPLSLVYFVVYFAIFRFAILKWNLKTPGREDDENVKLMSKADYRRATGIGVAGGRAASPEAGVDERSADILRAVGGTGNVLEVDCCATRLRLTLADGNVVDEALLKGTGASGVVRKGNALQVIYGPAVSLVKINFEDLIEGIRDGRVDESLIMESCAGEDGANPNAGSEASASAESKEGGPDFILGSHMNGTMLLIQEVKDEAFASGMLGDGIAVEPSEGRLFAPCDATVELVFDTKHAIGLTTDDGMEVLLHIGIDTLSLNGRHFEVLVEQGSSVKKGDLLATFDLDAIKSAGYSVTTPMVICNSDDYQYMKPLATGSVKATQDLLFIKG